MADYVGSEKTTRYKSTVPNSIYDDKSNNIACGPVGTTLGETKVDLGTPSNEPGAELVWKCGGKAFCPHLNTAFMGGVVPDAVFLRADLEWLADCDAVYAIHGWSGSEGAKGEVDEAKRLGKIVITDEEVLRVWIRNALFARGTA